MNDISTNFKGTNPYEKSVIKNLLKHEETPEAIKYFAKKCDGLGDYAYWYVLSTLWVSYTGWSDLNLWKELFNSDRPGKKKSIMKPSELKEFERLPWFVTVYRAHRQGEEDWIAYTLDKEIALRFARERNVNEIKEYRVKRKDITALFLRRGEQEVIVTDKSKVEFVKSRKAYLIKGVKFS